MKIAVCDDSVFDLENLIKILTQYFKSKNIGAHIDKFSNPQILLNKILIDGANYYDVYILDIVMQKNGIDVAKSILQKNENAIIIFQTSSREFAVEAFRVRAFDYILKPLDQRQIFDCLGRLNIAFEQEKKDIFQLKTNDLNLVTIKINEIMYIESKDRRLLFHMKNREIISSTMLRTKFLESIPFDYERLHFIECHNSFVVNMHYISTIQNSDFKLSNNELVPISKRLYKDAKEKYIKYLIGE